MVRLLSWKPLFSDWRHISRMGKVEDGNTVSDYDKMEVERGYSINTSVVPMPGKNKDPISSIPRDISISWVK